MFHLLDSWNFYETTNTIIVIYFYKYCLCSTHVISKLIFNVPYNYD